MEEIVGINLIGIRVTSFEQSKKIFINNLGLFF